jgi:hypothetical protein
MTRAWKFAVALALAIGWIVNTGTPASAAGRWKKENGKCVWDAKDSGPDQCQPPAGRYKKQGDNCVWDANDDGADQCRPAKGRFKINNGKCEWTASDSGPDQCRPKPQPRR